MLRQDNLTLSDDQTMWEYKFSPDVYPGNLLDVLHSNVPSYCNITKYFMYDNVPQRKENNDISITNYARESENLRL